MTEEEFVDKLVEIIAQDGNLITDGACYEQAIEFIEESDEVDAILDSIDGEKLTMLIELLISKYDTFNDKLVEALRKNE
jgi:DNA-binding ferritin-like protein (Dps family)